MRVRRDNLVMSVIRGARINQRAPLELRLGFPYNVIGF